MLENKHTAPPWECGDTDDTTICVWAYSSADDTEGRIVAEVKAEDVPHAECVANALLIAAAPDLLAACEKAMHCLTCEEPHEWTESQKYDEAPYHWLYLSIIKACGVAQKGW